MYRQISENEKRKAKGVNFNEFMQAEYPWDIRKDSKNSSRWIHNSHIVFVSSGYFFNGRYSHDHGDGIEFLRKHMGLSYPEAVAKLYEYALMHSSEK